MDKIYKQFVNKLNAYIKRFYLYQLVRGLILFVLLMILYFSLITSLEYFSYFDPSIKVIIVLVTLFITLSIFGFFIVVPLIKLLGLGKRLSYYDVSEQLNKTYPEIKDRLVNIIELENSSDLVYSLDLKQASIEQKINELRIFNFSEAIRFKDLKTIFVVFLWVFILFVGAFSFSSDFFTESSVRLVNFQERFIKPAPFVFHLENGSLDVITGESIDISVSCSGKEIPEMVYISIGGSNFLMSNENGVFKYTLEHVNSSLSFYFTDKKYNSEVYKIKVINKPFISSFKVEIKPPHYTNLAAENYQNKGDLKIPSGSEVNWIFNTVDTDSLFLVLNDSTILYADRSGSSFKLSRTFYSDTQYSISIKNARLSDNNSLVYKIQTVSDLFPEIRVVRVQDSLDFHVFHFMGNILDDYGFHELNFNIKTDLGDSSISIPFTPFLLNQDFYYSFNFQSLKNFGKSFSYFFSVSDNDFINHFKQSISETFTFIFPDYEDILAKESTDQSILDQLFKKSSRLTQEIQQEFKSLKLKQVNSELTDWEKFQSVKDIMNKKSELENTLDQIKKLNKDASNFLNSFSDEKKEILEKQAQIDELLKDVFNDELKKLFEQFNELAKQFDSKKFEQISKSMDTNLDDLSKQLDKNVQLLKKMKVEQKIERVIAELNRLKEKEQITRENLNKKSDLDMVGKEEKESLLRIKNLENDYKGALELNSELDKPMNLFQFDKEFSALKNNIEKIISDAENRNKRKANEGLDDNAKDIDQLVFAMNQMLANTKSKQSQENIEDLKQILDNLIIVSFTQEDLMKKLSTMDYNNPLVNLLKIKQLNLNTQILFVKDSLYALSRCTPEISSVINKEMNSLETSGKQAFDFLENNNIPVSRMQQQYGVTAANNLALFLSEALENIKKQQENSMPGDGDCEKPGGKNSKPGLNSMKESQASMKDQLQKMIDQMKKGDLGNMSKSIGQTLAQQEIMQQLINEMLNSGSVGSKASDQLKTINQLLEQSRKDLISKNITSELISRQNLILSKLLDAERSEIERDKDDKRESKTAVDIKKDQPGGYFQFNSELDNQRELIKRNSNKLKSFYDQKYNSFINQMKN